MPTAWRDESLSIRYVLKDLTKSTRVPHLLGMNAHQFDAAGKHRRYNSALLVSPVFDAKGKIDGHLDPKLKFDKIHRVPFGEYLPFGDWLPFMAYLTPYEGDFGILAGDKLTRFPLGKYHFGVLLCYEDTDPFLARRYLEDSDDGPPVDFLVNMSNDGWFDGTEQHEQHFAICRFRAVESRRSVVRAVNMGISGIIDPDGRVKELPDYEWGDSKKKVAIVTGEVPLDSRGSFYALAGDWVPGLCAALVLAGLIRGRRRATRVV